MSKQAQQVTLARVDPPVTPERIAELRRAIKREWHWSSRAFAKHFHVSHTLIYLMEKGQRPIRETFADLFQSLDREFQKDTRKRGRPSKAIQIISAFPLPARYHVLHPVVQCKCGNWFERMKRNQRRCRPGCHGPVRRKRRKKS